MKKQNPFIKNRWEICYNLINGMIAGSLVFLGAFSSGEISRDTILFAFIAMGVIFITKFKEYWDGEKAEYSKAFNFINP